MLTLTLRLAFPLHYATPSTRCIPALKSSQLLLQACPRSRPFSATMAAAQEWLVVVPDFDGVLDKRMEVRECVDGSSSSAET